MSNALTVDAIKSAQLIVQKLLAVKAGEEVVLVADTETDMEMAQALAGVAESLGAEFTIAIMPSRPHERGNQMTRFIEKGLESADVVIGLTRASGAPTYNKTIARLLENKKTRNMSMVLRDMANWTRGGATADYDRMAAEAAVLRDFWETAQQVRVTSALGTDLTATIRGEKVIIEAGFATEPGLEAAFSDGEVSQMPNEGSANGVIVVDGPIAYLGLSREPIRLVVKNGRVVEVQGNSREAARLRDILARVPNADNIAELGIGLNPKSLKNGDFEEEKKGRGNIHVALGSNIFYGGTVHCEVHMDTVIYDTTVEFDGRPVIQAGQLILPAPVADRK